MGAGHQLREKSHIQGIVEKRVPRAFSVAVNVKGIGQGLKSIKRDAQGQDNVGCPAANRTACSHPQKNLNIFQKKPGIF